MIKLPLLTSKLSSNSEYIYILDLDKTVINNEHLSNLSDHEFLINSKDADPYPEMKQWIFKEIENIMYLTGRSHAYIIETLDWLSKHGLLKDKEQLITKDSQKLDLYHEEVCHFKARIILHWLRIYPNKKFIFVDDDENNLRVANAFQHKRLTVIHAEEFRKNYIISNIVDNQR